MTRRCLWLLSYWTRTVGLTCDTAMYRRTHMSSEYYRAFHYTAVGLIVCSAAYWAWITASTFSPFELSILLFGYSPLLVMSILLFTPTMRCIRSRLIVALCLCLLGFVGSVMLVFVLLPLIPVFLVGLISCAMEVCAREETMLTRAASSQ
jgi:hypothetical protein